ncbi:MAG: hypothetical protein DWB56_02170 [Candidatus Jettenia sp.]|uniref:hypothetical protein n=1 Tax=Candidatus Jettenia sp. AMX1 TaxID=2293637 RepID=UPI0003260474|nr:hypothetical protein [Candidatus Jettenia sp. AMX1]MBC6927763.1 hypothetical protein [Candidatus Jettenia sp.]WKZ14643.1 MAG: hypothetical protein QY317_12115 [Candidatus Jettenia caeni]KAA0251446.1 MAG: hypothetical protein EDM77_01755 [Candidatus Jettenia sp. AMX1]MCE7879429.1 hypothetical protein [Candidatus Jettenia sp. AMX1]MDL1938378.1 hypothetical protein [Candidatus Jettenia sp. AMX1]
MKKHASLRFSHSTVALPVIPECLYRESSRQKKQERYWISDKLVLVKTGNHSGMTSKTGE